MVPGAPTILIAGLSARALCAAARRSGLVPLAADLFGDEDTRALAAAVEAPVGTLEDGIGGAALVAALERLSGAAPSPPIGLVLGSGFEDRPDLVETLAARWPFFGCSAAAIRAVKEPRLFFPLLQRLGIAHPETRFEPPETHSGWLVKSVGASGGGHVHRLLAGLSTAPGSSYFQRYVSGVALSLGAIAWTGGAIPLGVTEQWRAPQRGAPFRYGGALGPVAVGSAVETSMVDALAAIVRATGLAGLVSADFVLGHDDLPLLLEVNPRAGATLDVLDPPGRHLLRAHVCASLGEPPEIGPPDGLVHAAAVLYADEGGAVAPARWPDWCADRGAAGAETPSGAPVATILAEAETPAAARTILDARTRAARRLVAATSSATRRPDKIAS